mmetsp:Transcript_48166/g.109632  ORF Transcript_48166/g.109632 Transcript_48166/m.109632 type:complete len:809 (+) Transcript_48166:56-2482(+)
MPVAWQLVILLSCAASAGSSQAGAPECPCLDAASFEAQEAHGTLANLSLPQNYGLAGCQAYDAYRSSVLASCSGAHPGDKEMAFCFSSWCYVDPRICQVNASQCARLGDPDNIMCRDREKKLSNHLALKSLGLYYSYSTCGFLDSYTAHAGIQDVMNSTLLVSCMSDWPWVVEGYRWKGVLFNFVQEACWDEFKCTFSFADPVVSQESIAAVGPSKWNGCIHDVAIGRLDMCIGSFWITEERQQMVTFLPPLFQAHWYLVTPKVEAEGFWKLWKWEILKKPFKPFSARLWISIATFLAIGGLVFALVEAPGYALDRGRPGEHRFYQALYGLYLSFTWCCAGGSISRPKTFAGRLVTLGLGCMLLFVVACYTASLASLLVAERGQEPVKSLEEAIQRKMRVCMVADISAQVLRDFPSLEELLVEVSSSIPGDFPSLEALTCPRLVLEGKADVMLLEQDDFDRIHSGEAVERDCGVDAAGTEEERRTYCLRTQSGKLDMARDCGLQQVGGRVLSLSVSFPVVKRLQHSLAWMTTKAVARGQLSRSRQQYSASHPKVCPKEQATSDGFPLSAMLGMLVVSGSVVFTGAAVFALSRLALSCQGCCCRRRAKASHAGRRRVHPEEEKAYQEEEKAEGETHHAWAPQTRDRLFWYRDAFVDASELPERKMEACVEVTVHPEEQAPGAQQLVLLQQELDFLRMMQTDMDFKAQERQLELLRLLRQMPCAKRDQEILPQAKHEWEEIQKARLELEQEWEQLQRSKECEQVWMEKERQRRDRRLPKAQQRKVEAQLPDDAVSDDQAIEQLLRSLPSF